MDIIEHVKHQGDNISKPGMGQESSPTQEDQKMAAQDSDASSPHLTNRNEIEHRTRDNTKMERMSAALIIIFFIYFNCACTYPIIPHTQQTEREPQYPAPACTTLLYLMALLGARTPFAFTRKVGLPYYQPPVWRVCGKGHYGENHCGENPR
jgi:hypothetical protein